MSVRPPQQSFVQCERAVFGRPRHKDGDRVVRNGLRKAVCDIGVGHADQTGEHGIGDDENDGDDRGAACGK